MTTSSSAARRPVVGFLFALAGVLWLIAIFTPHLIVASGINWLAVIAVAALTIAFLFLFIGKSAKLLTRIAFLVATVGWAILTLNDLKILDAIHNVGLIVALVGILVSGILVALHHLFSRLADLLFLIGSILISLELLEELTTKFLSGSLGTVVDYAEAIILALAGIVIALRK
jgi:hypothetical protein